MRKLNDNKLLSIFLIACLFFLLKGTRYSSVFSNINQVIFIIGMFSSASLSLLNLYLKTSSQKTINILNKQLSTQVLSPVIKMTYKYIFIISLTIIILNSVIVGNDVGVKIIVITMYLLSGSLGYYFGIKKILNPNKNAKPLSNNDILK